MPIRVLVADDDPLIREGLEVILGRSEDFKLVCSVSNGRRALEACLSYAVDIALLDIRMPILDGVKATRRICEQTAVKVIILTTFEEDELIQEAIAAGAKGYLLKGMSAEEISDVVRLVYRGHTIFKNSVFEKLRQGENHRLDPALFSQREMEIIPLIAEGLSNREIGERLFLSEGTVKNYITTILTKLNLRQRTQIAAYYLKGTQGPS